MKILVVHTFGLGDTVMFTPALKMLYKKFPDAQFDFLIFQKHSAAPLEDFPGRGEIIHASFKPLALLSLLRRLRKTRYDAAVHTSGTSVLKMALFMLFVKAVKKIGEYDKFKFLWYTEQIKKRKKHRTESNIALAESLGCVYDNESPEYWADRSKKEEAEKFFAGMPPNQLKIGIHPGCNAAHSEKRWAVENYIRLIGQLLQNHSDISVHVFIGPDEKEVGQAIEQACGLKPVCRDISVTAEMIGRMDIMITNDSGLGHIASCYDTRIITIFSEKSMTDEWKVYPFSPLSVLIDFRTMKETEDQVYEVYKVLNGMINECRS